MVLTSFSHPPSAISDLFLVWPVFHNTALLILGLNSTYERKHVAYDFLNLANLMKVNFKIIFFQKDQVWITSCHF
jgi:hypothetical protein